MQARGVRMGPAVGSVRTCPGGLPAGGAVVAIECGGRELVRGGNHALPPDWHVASVGRHHSASVVREVTMAARRGIAKAIFHGGGDATSERWG